MGLFCFLLNDSADRILVICMQIASPYSIHHFLYLWATVCTARVNPRAGNGILHPYTGNGGGKLPPRAFQVMILANG